MPNRRQNRSIRGSKRASVPYQRGQKAWASSDTGPAYAPMNTARGCVVGTGPARSSPLTADIPLAAGRSLQGPTGPSGGLGCVKTAVGTFDRYPDTYRIRTLTPVELLVGGLALARLEATLQM
jgi:hypothetical protein